jgi:ribonucleoside-diphosphate reductase alpha chain
MLEELKAVVRQTNEEWSELLGIKPATSITCVKPSGTVSQLVGASSGIHTRWSRFYERRIKQDIKDPMTKVLMDSGVPWEPENDNPDQTVIFPFPQRSPDCSLVNDDRTSAVDQLEHWLLFKKHWATHSVSATIYVKWEEWLEVGAWVYKNFDDISGLSFLPYDGGVYTQAPYTTIDEEAYYKAVEKMPTEIDWNIVEHSDQTEGVQNLACTGGACEL